MHWQNKLIAALIMQCDNLTYLRYLKFIKNSNKIPDLTAEFIQGIFQCHIDTKASLFYAGENYLSITFNHRGYSEDTENIKNL